MFVLIENLPKNLFYLFSGIMMRRGVLETATTTIETGTITETETAVVAEVVATEVEEEEARLSVRRPATRSSSTAASPPRRTWTSWRPELRQEHPENSRCRPR